MICPKCHSEVIDSARFCDNCGTPLHTLKSAESTAENNRTPVEKEVPKETTYSISKTEIMEHADTAEENVTILSKELPVQPIIETADNISTTAFNKDNAGKTITDLIVEDSTVESSNITSIETEEPSTTAEQTPLNDDTVTKKEIKKKKIGKVFLIIFLILAIISGATLGFLSAKQIINPSNLFDFARFHWSEPSEVIIENNHSTDDDVKTDKTAEIDETTDAESTDQINKESSDDAKSEEDTTSLGNE